MWTWKILLAAALTNLADVLSTYRGVFLLDGGYGWEGNFIMVEMWNLIGFWNTSFIKIWMATFIYWFVLFSPWFKGGSDYFNKFKFFYATFFIYFTITISFFNLMV